MTVYVDDMKRVSDVSGFSAVWSHLFADTRQELDEFADKLGLKRNWIQCAGTYREHYDLIERRRQRALQLGAVEISYPRGTANLLAYKRQKNGNGLHAE